MEATPSTLALRYKAVVAYERLKSWKGAANEVGKSVRYVKTWVGRHRAGMSLADKKRAGRPTLGLDTDGAMLVMDKSISEGLAPAQIALRLKSRLNIRAHEETVRRWLKQHLARPLRQQRKPKLQATHTTDRLAYCKEWIRKDWSNVVVTDSKYFWLCPRGYGPKVWVRYGEEAPYAAAERNCYKVHAYAGVSKYGRTPLIVTVGTTGLQSSTKGVTGEVYKQILQEELIPACRKLMRKGGKGWSDRSWIFQQDNAKPHTSRVVTAWLKAQKFTVMKWPAKSPDLSWIENLWGYVAVKLSKRTDLTKENFMHACQDEWNNIPDEVHIKFYDSIHSRLQACIDCNGGSTKH